MAFDKKPGRPGSPRKPGGVSRSRKKGASDARGTGPVRPVVSSQDRAERKNAAAPTSRPKREERPATRGAAPKPRSRGPEGAPQERPARGKGPQKSSRPQRDIRPGVRGGSAKPRSRGPEEAPQERPERGTGAEPTSRPKRGERPAPRSRAQVTPHRRPDTAAAQERPERAGSTRPPVGRREGGPASRSVRRKEQAVDERQQRRTEAERPEQSSERPQTQRGRLVKRGGPSRGHKRDRRAVKFDINWVNLQSLYDFWGNRIQRYFGMQSLVRATEGVLHGNDRFLVPSAQLIIGPAPLTSMTFELRQEGKFQLIFLMRAVNDKRKIASFAFVVAKRPGEFSKVAVEEFDNLMTLHGRDPEHIVRPYRASKLMVFDRNLGDEPKPIFAYLTQWLNDYHELGVTKNLQFYVNIKTPVTFTAVQTEDIKAQIIGVIAKSYDAEAGLAMEMPQIASGDFVVTLPSAGKPRIKLIACRRLLRNMTPTRVIHRILDAHWDWGGRDFRLAPEKAETILLGLERALGKETAMAWLTDYRKRLEAGTFREVAPLTLEALKELGA